MINKATLLGNLGADPETRYMQDGTCVCNIRIATTERFKDRSGETQERTEWHRVVLWGKLGEIAAQYLRKGSQVYIEGKIETRKWTNKEGLDVYTTEIRANEMKMLGGKSDSNASQAPSGTQRPTQAPTGNTAKGTHHSDPFADAPGYDNVPVDDDIPFN